MFPNLNMQKWLFIENNELEKHSIEKSAFK